MMNSNMTELKTILVVEDDKLNAKLLRDLLSHLGYHVDVFGSAEDAEEHLKIARPHLILLDIKLPGRSGIDLVKDIKFAEVTNKIPVFAISSWNKEDMLFEAEMGLFNEYLTKPIVSSNLIELVKRYIGEARTEDDS